MRHRTLLAVLASLLILSIASVAWAQTRFADVPADHEHIDAVEYAAEKGWFAGYGDGTFKPDQLISAEQAALVFGRAFPDGVSRAKFASILYIADGNLPTTTTTAAQPETCSDVVCVIDHYSFERSSLDFYAVKFEVSATCSALYVEVHLLDENSRRTGDWSNEFRREAQPGDWFTVELIVSNPSVFKKWEWEANCR